jgi:sarcosine oxidase subunit alpha
LSTGAIEQGLIFPHNDRPGIMLASAVRRYLNGYAVCAGNHIVVATNNDTAYQTVFDLAHESIAVSTVVDCRGTVDPVLEQRLSDLGTRLMTGCRIANTRGARGLTSVQVEDMGGQHKTRIQCDLLAVSGGWAPRVHLLAHARGSLRFDPVSQSFIPDQLPPGLSVGGAANGTASLQETLTEASILATSICESLGSAVEPCQSPIVTAAIVESRSVAPTPLDTTKPRQWIDLAHDVTFGDAELAVREGFIPVEHFKRYTTTGMSVDQGKTGNINAFIVLGALTGREAGEVGTTTFRPPYTPVTLGAIAGRNTGEFYAPRRYLPAHQVHEQLSARMEDYDWQRPDYYSLPDESPEKSIHREVLAVRNHVGVFDNSPIGKLEVRGPDAAEFLNRLYINNVHSLAVGRVRYGLMLNENGVIIDDGVFIRLADNHFLVNTTSAGVARIGALMEQWLQCEWRELRVLIDDVTTQWANFTLAGPHARDVLTDLGADLVITADALPHMAAAVGRVAGREARVVRVSFSGELSYEVNVPANQAASFLNEALEAGTAYGIAPYGMEALMVLRMEKGYLHVGSDTDGSSTPDDVGWGRVARNKKTDYIGKRSLFRPANVDPDRKQFVGLEPLDPQQRLRPGGHLLGGVNRLPPAITEGWVTSACFSPTLGRHIALGVLQGGSQRLGETLTFCDENKRHTVQVVSPTFYDPDGEKMND